MTPLPRELLAPRHWATWLGVGVLFVLSRLPWQIRHWLGKQIGRLLYRYHHKRRNVVLTNLLLCFPAQDEAQHEQLAQQHLQEYASALLDYSVLFFRPRPWLYQRIQIDGSEHLNHAIAAQQNVILLVAHSVWLEFAGVGLGEHYRLLGFYKPFRNPVVNWLIARSRQHDADALVAREEGMRKLVSTLEPGRLLFFLPDEDHGEKHSVFAPFFAASKATLTTPARLCKLGKALALPVMAYFDAQTGNYCIRIESPLNDFASLDELQAATRMNAALQHLIARHPAQYMWILKLFRTRPANQPAVY